MTVAELRRFRAYRNMILSHGMTELYHETEYNELKDKVLEYLDSFPNDTIRAIAYFYYVNASSIHSLLYKIGTKWGANPQSGLVWDIKLTTKMR